MYFCFIGLVSLLSSLQGNVLITIAAAFALSDAMDETNAAKALAASIIAVFGHMVLQNNLHVLFRYLKQGQIGLLLGIFIPTVFLTSVLSNTAVVNIMFPIVYD
jgi:di/tricarboxylate transporter